MKDKPTKDAAVEGPDLSGLPRSVLFVCNQNAIRSPMAKALLDKYSKKRIYADSVGLITGMLDCFTAEVVQEVGGSRLHDHKPKTLNTINLQDYEIVIALSTAAFEQMQSKLADTEVTLEFWPIPDPAGAEGRREHIISAYRNVRDLIGKHIKERFQFD